MYIHHTGNPDATNAEGDNPRGYKQWCHMNTHVKKTPNSSLSFILFGMLFCTVHVKWHFFQQMHAPLQTRSSDQGLHSLPFRLHHLDIVKPYFSNFRIITTIFWVSEYLGILRYLLTQGQWGKDWYDWQLLLDTQSSPHYPEIQSDCGRRWGSY